MAKKYPIGTKIRFLYRYADTGKIGRIVAIDYGRPVIYIPTAQKHIDGYNPIWRGTDKAYTWICAWNELEKVSEVGDQLLFSFMER